MSTTSWDPGRIEERFRSVEREIRDVREHADAIDRDGSRGLIDARADIRGMREDLHGVERRLSALETAITSLRDRREVKRWQLVLALLGMAVPSFATLVAVLVLLA